MTDYITFFHHSEEYREEFTHKDPIRPCFYWFSDRFHSHCGQYPYFYLFVKNPITSNIAMRVRSGENLDFHDLYTHFLDYRDVGIPKVAKGDIQYAEPPIIMSFSKIVPDLIAKYHEDTDDYEIIKPVACSTIRFRFNESSSKFQSSALGIPFTKISELTHALSVLKVSLPFEDPEYIGGKYVYKNWIPMKTEKNGTWL